MSGKKRIFINQGTRFGRLTVLHEGMQHGKLRYYSCVCDCGVRKEILMKGILNGTIQSCGCYHTEVMRKHGQSKAPIYNTYRSMLKRCYNPNHKSYSSYGGRGICVCDDWINNFEAFYEWACQSGYIKGLTLDRIDNNGCYSPSNCRWATLITQANNRRDNVWYDFNGSKMTLAQICREFGIADKRDLVRQRIYKYGWDLMDAISAYL